MAELLSQRQYAESRRVRGLSGGSLAAVQKAIASGRISLVVEQRTGKKKIDREIADAQWDRNTDPEQQLRGNGGVLPVAAPAQLDLAGPAANPASQEDGEAVQADRGGDREELLRRRTESAELENELKRLDLAKRRGELVSLADEREVRTRRYRAIRDKFLGLPDREAALMAAELKVDAVQLHAALERMVKKALHELSDDARAEADRGIAEPLAA